MTGALTVVALVLASGCTVEAGTGFGTLDEALVAAAFEPGGRLDDGSFLVLGGSRITPTTMNVELGDVRLDALVPGTGGTGGTFDPANPPPGYTNCHAGHCHHIDGRLVDYEDIQAELSGGSGDAYVTRATLPVDRSLDLLAPVAVTLEEVLPSRELPETTLSRVQLDVRRFTMEGTATGGGLGAEAVPIRVDVRVEGVISSLEANREVSVDAAPSVTVAVDLRVSATFLDDLDLAAASSDGAIVIDSGAIADSVALEILTMPLGVELE